MKTTILTAILTVTAIGLTACDYVPFTPQSRIAAAKAKIEIRSHNPTTIRFSDVQEFKGAVCGVFNEERRIRSYGTEMEWSGPQSFVTIDGDPHVVSNYSDCEAGVGAWSRCFNQGDEAKVTADVQACKSFQAENEQESREQIEQFFGTEGLVSSGSHERDARTWDERQTQFDKGPQGIFGRELSVQVDSWTVWKRGYNAHMRTLPATATDAQKITAAAQAVVQANAATEAYLTAEGFRG